VNIALAEREMIKVGIWIRSYVVKDTHRFAGNLICGRKEDES